MEIQFAEVRIELDEDSPDVRDTPQIRFEGEIPDCSFLPAARGLNTELLLPEAIRLQAGEERFCFLSVLSPSALAYSSAVR